MVEGAWERAFLTSGMFNQLLNYLSGVRAELKEIKWPSTGQTLGYTAIVIAISLIVAFLVGGLDYVFSLLAGKVIGIFH
jgi:preprotein translocase subunit SecE